jgi:hypothetical protein
VLGMRQRPGLRSDMTRATKAVRKPAGGAAGTSPCYVAVTLRGRPPSLPFARELAALR